MSKVRTFLMLGLLVVGGAFLAGCNNCCEPNPCDPCAPNPCDPCAAGQQAAPAAAPAAAPSATPAGSCGGSGKG